MHRQKDRAAFRLALGVDEGFVGVRIVWMPAAKGRAVFDDVADSPSNALFVKLAGDVVVGAKDVEVTAAHAFDEKIGCLLSRPGAGRFLGKPFPRRSRHVREDEAGDQQVGGDLAILGVAKFMGQRLGEDLERRFGDIVGGVAGWGGDALFGAGVDDRARTTPGQPCRARKLGCR